MALLRFSAAAEADIISVLAWSESQFGVTARRRYEKLLVTAIQDIGARPDCVGSVLRPELGPGICSYHLFHSREKARTEDGIVQRPRHLLLYRAMMPEVIGIGRVLHDAMDIGRNLPLDYGDEAAG